MAIASRPSFTTGQVRIQASNAEMHHLFERVTLSSGTCPILRLADDGPAYQENARIPTAPFRLPDLDEASAIWRQRPTSECQLDIGLVWLGESCCEPLRTLHESTAPPRTRSYAAAVDSAATTIVETTRDRINWIGTPVLTGIAEHTSGLLTITVNSECGRRTGLHVDSWYAAQISGRQDSPRRLCLNIGRSDRWFLVINRPLVQIAEDLGINRDSEVCGVDKLAGRFLSEFPDYPVLRIKIRPGEAYIAATEALIHDGSSLGGSDPDLCYTFFGHFRLERGCGT